jgi:hypothetical protein
MRPTGELLCSGPDDDAPGLGPHSLVDLTSISEITRFSKPWSQTFISSTLTPVALPWKTDIHWLFIECWCWCWCSCRVSLGFSHSHDMIWPIGLTSRQHRPDDPGVFGGHGDTGLVKAPSCDELGDPLINSSWPVGVVHKHGARTVYEQGSQV